jgi:hypothetical protein
MLARNGRRVSSLMVVGMALLLLTGCGESTGTVSGRVTFNGKELDGGFVSFASEKNTTVPPIRVKINSDGSYKAPGIAYGVNKIGVEPPQKSAASLMKDKGKMPEDKDMAKAKEVYGVTGGGGTYVDIPSAFRNPETSNLVVTVDSSTKKHDIDVPSK